MFLPHQKVNYILQPIVLSPTQSYLILGSFGYSHIYIQESSGHKNNLMILTENLTQTESVSQETQSRMEKDSIELNSLLRHVDMRVQHISSVKMIDHRISYQVSLTNM